MEIVPACLSEVHLYVGVPPLPTVVVKLTFVPAQIVVPGVVVIATVGTAVPLTTTL